MQLTYDQMAEVIRRLDGGIDAVGDVISAVVGEEVSYADIPAQQSVVIETAVPVCEVCGVRGLGAGMVENPSTGDMAHKRCQREERQKGDAPL